ncbi:MAG: hypothetical protein PCFJNLEI_00163 [Verrucomicrobiae bacterium]|nr:hypothetical protein [Verrucomicrobiae bacterium]
MKNIALAVLMAGTANAAVVTYPAPPEISPSPYYQVTVNGKPVFVYPVNVPTIADAQGKLLPNRHVIFKNSPAAMCSFDTSGSARITVTVLDGAPQGALESVVVRPLRHGIKPKLKGNTLTFSVKGPVQLSIEPNGSILAPLFIFANPMEKNPPKPDAPGVRYLGPGVHDIGKIQVPSDSTLYLAGGAYVYGQLNSENVTNVTVRGRGILNGSRGDADRHVRWFKSKDIRMEGITLVDCRSWGIKLLHCDDVTIQNVKIINPAADAIDACSSDNVTVDGVFARTHDDTFNVKGLTDALGHGYPADANKKWSPEGYRRSARNIKYLNSVVWNDRAHALMIGPETRATEITDILFKDIDVIHAVSVDVIGIFSSDAAPISNVRYENIRIEDARVQTLVELRVHHAYTTADSTMGVISNVVFRNVSITTPTPLYSAICADSNTVTGVHFEKFIYNGVVATNPASMYLHIRGDARDITFPKPKK